MDGRVSTWMRCQPLARGDSSFWGLHRVCGNVRLFRCFCTFAVGKCAEPLVQGVVFTRTLKSNVYETLAGVAFSQHTVQASPAENLFMLLLFLVLLFLLLWFSA